MSFVEEHLELGVLEIPEDWREYRRDLHHMPGSIILLCINLKTWPEVGMRLKSTNK